MKRTVVAAAVVSLLLFLSFPEEEGPRAEGGHAPGITMEPDTILTGATPDSTTDYVQYDIANPDINRLIDLLVSTTYDSLGFPIPSSELNRFLDEIALNHDNSLGYPMSDFELVFRYFAGGDTFPYLSFYDIPDTAERNHVDIYLYAYWQDCINSAYTSPVQDPDEDQSGPYHRNSVSVAGPCPSSTIPNNEECRPYTYGHECSFFNGDGIWYRYSAPTWAHEFAHMCYSAQGKKLGLTLRNATDEMFAHAAGYLAGSPRKQPIYNVKYDAGLIDGRDIPLSPQGGYNRRRNLWNLWGAYLLQHFQWPDTADIQDDLLYR
jgi:hypothetical protein